MTTPKDVFIEQLNDINADFSKLVKMSEHADLSDINTESLSEIVVRSKAAIERITGKSSSYSARLAEIHSVNTHAGLKARAYMGCVRGLLKDLSKGYLVSYSELVHSEVFSDFIEMAAYLLNQSYKDPAAVIAGSTLESHIKKLCIKNLIPVTRTDASGSLIHIKADALNSELAKAGVYNVGMQKSITAWLDLRNKAAHGKYAEYAKEQVDMMLQGVTHLIATYPA